MREYHRPIVTEGEGLPLAGGPSRFARVEVLRRGAPAGIVAAETLAPAVLDRLTAPRPLPPGCVAGRPAVMGILNVTPDSFSDGGRHWHPRLTADEAQAAIDRMAAAGADIIDLGAESTRPGARPVPTKEQLVRLYPFRNVVTDRAISIDTRDETVMDAAVRAGAAIINDVSALTFDFRAVDTVAQLGCRVVLMHHQGDPQTMQVAPRYDDALLDVYDWLAARIDAVVAAGVRRDRIIADPGIGFGKTLDHNLAILRGLTLFHGLGVPLLLGASRKSLIARIAPAASPVEHAAKGGSDQGGLPLAPAPSPGPPADARLPGSLALALHGAACGVQMLRVHDVAETVQALAVWRAARG